MLAELGIVPAAGLADDLGQVLAATTPDRYPVFSPGDVCPDNNLLTDQGLWMVDFEGAGYHSVFLDAAYARMPFATCWCVFRLPAAVAARVEVARGYPALVDDAVWVPGVRRAMAAWTVAIPGLLLPRALVGDEPLHPGRRPVPTRRQLLRYRWQWLAAELTGAADLPALAGTLRQLLAATRGWAVPPLPRYPAYRRRRAPAGDRNGASGPISG